MPTIQIGSHTVEYRIDRSARCRRMRLVVTPQRTVYVTAAPSDTDRLVEQFVHRSRDWLRKQLYPSEPPAEPVHVVDDGNGPIEFRVMRNPRRKRITAYWRPRGGLEVRAPTGVPRAQIEQFVRDNAAAIRGRTEEIVEEAAPAREWVGGETIRLQGAELSLDVVPRGSTSRAEREGGRLVVTVPEDTPAGEVSHIVRDAVVRFLSKEAAAAVNRRLPALAARVGAAPGRITIKDTRSRHGSCSAAGNITIAYRLVMAPPEVLDYVIIHELCHIHHPNHSRDFWALVGRMMPDYERHKRWLKDNGELLTL